MRSEKEEQPSSFLHSHSARFSFPRTWEGKFNYQVLLLLKGETILSKHKEFFIVKDMDLLPSQRKHQPCPRPKLKSINK